MQGMFSSILTSTSRLRHQDLGSRSLTSIIMMRSVLMLLSRMLWRAGFEVCFWGHPGLAFSLVDG